VKALKITLAVLMVILAGLFYAAFLQNWKAGPGHEAPSLAPQTMGDAAGAEAWAEVPLRKMNYLKDPHSLSRASLMSGVMHFNNEYRNTMFL
jgi:hypothetical protein